DGHGHQVRGGEDDAGGIAVAQGRVGEASGKAAEPVVVVLHYQRVDLALRHRFADRGPAAFELARGNRIEQPFVRHLFVHAAELWLRWSGAKPATVLRCKSARIEAATNLPGRAAPLRWFPRLPLAASATACRYR